MMLLSSVPTYCSPCASAGPHMDMQPEDHAMHIDFESLRNVQLITINAEVLVIVAGSHMNMHSQQHEMHSGFEYLRCVQLISINDAAGKHLR